jgi:hypothetical protein
MLVGANYVIGYQDTFGILTGAWEEWMYVYYTVLIRTCHEGHDRSSGL